MMDNDDLEAAWRQFAKERRNTGDEQTALKHTCYLVVCKQLKPWLSLVDELGAYLLAYTGHHAPPGGQEHALMLRHRLRDMIQALHRMTRDMEREGEWDQVDI